MNNNIKNNSDNIINVSDNNFPKIIHQIWLQGYKNLSVDNKKKIEITKQINSNWKYILWDEIKILELINEDTNLINKYYKFIYLHQKVDFSKFVILYKYGGIYLDMDCEVVKNLDKLVEENSQHDMIISKLSDKVNGMINYVTCRSFDTCLNNGVILTKKSTDICDYLIKNFLSECGLIENKVICIQNTTGPVIFNKLINDYIKNINISKILILPHYYLEPCIGDDCDINENTYVIHKHELSWLGNNEIQIMNYYLKNEILINNILIIILIVIILIIYYYIFYKTKQK